MKPWQRFSFGGLEGANFPSSGRSRIHVESVQNEALEMKPQTLVLCSRTRYTCTLLAGLNAVLPLLPNWLVSLLLPLAPSLEKSATLTLTERRRLLSFFATRDLKSPESEDDGLTIVLRSDGPETRGDTLSLATLFLIPQEVLCSTGRVAVLTPLSHFSSLWQSSLPAGLQLIARGNYVGGVLLVLAHNLVSTLLYSRLDSS